MLQRHCLLISLYVQLTVLNSTVSALTKSTNQDMSPMGYSLSGIYNSSYFHSVNLSPIVSMTLAKCTLCKWHELSPQPTHSE